MRDATHAKTHGSSSLLLWKWALFVARYSPRSINLKRFMTHMNSHFHVYTTQLKRMKRTLSAFYDFWSPTYFAPHIADLPRRYLATAWDTIAEGDIIFLNFFKPHSMIWNRKGPHVFRRKTHMLVASAVSPNAALRHMDVLGNKRLPYACLLL